MFNVLHFRWTGHLPMAILYAPSASVWLLENSQSTLLVQQPWRKLPHQTGWYCFWKQVLTQRGPFPALSCLASTICAVLAISLSLLSTRLLYPREVATPLPKTHTVWSRLRRVTAPTEINCLACLIQTGKFLPQKLSHWLSHKRG